MSKDFLKFFKPGARRPLAGTRLVFYFLIPHECLIIVHMHKDKSATYYSQNYASTVGSSLENSSATAKQLSYIAIAILQGTVLNPCTGHSIICIPSYK